MLSDSAAKAVIVDDQCIDILAGIEHHETIILNLDNYSNDPVNTNISKVCISPDS